MEGDKLRRHLIQFFRWQLEQGYIDTEDKMYVPYEVAEKYLDEKGIEPEAEVKTMKQNEIYTLLLLLNIDEFLPEDHFIRLSNSYRKLTEAYKIKYERNNFTKERRGREVLHQLLTTHNFHR